MDCYCEYGIRVELSSFSIIAIDDISYVITKCKLDNSKTNSTIRTKRTLSSWCWILDEHFDVLLSHVRISMGGSVEWTSDICLPSSITQCRMNDHMVALCVRCFL